MSASKKPTTQREQALLDALRAMVIETMDYPPAPPYDTSFLPHHMIENAQRALDSYGLRVLPSRAMMAGGVPA